MRRFLQLVLVVFVSASFGACVSAKQKREEQQELERSIRTTSNPDDVKSCAFITNLKPDKGYSTPEAQAASFVIPRPGISWVVFGRSGKSELYFCKAPQGEPTAKPPTPTPVETKPETRTTAAVETKAAPAPRDSTPEVPAGNRPEEKTRVPEQPKPSAHKTRVTNNAEAVKGCKFLESFDDYQKVSHFQDDVVRTGGNIGYVVATNRDGDVIGESYLCPEVGKQ